MSVVFFTVCGGNAEEYEFLFGSIEHHSFMGQHVILDTTQRIAARTPRNLPRNVVWLYEPYYGDGWKSFRCVRALNAALKIAERLGDVVVLLDCDEFFTFEAFGDIFLPARSDLVQVHTVHHWKDGTARAFHESEWHSRAWPAKRGVRITTGDWWKHENFDGNYERHPQIIAPNGMAVVRIRGPLHHHLHYALGEKSKDDTTARLTIPGWTEGGTIMDPAKSSWPLPLIRWRDEGILPSRKFE